MVDREAGDDLAKIAVVVNDLRHRHAVLEERAAVLAGARFDLPVVERLVRGRSTQGVAELIEEQRKPRRQLDLRGARGVSRGDAQARAREDLSAMLLQEITKHERDTLGFGAANARSAACLRLARLDGLAPTCRVCGRIGRRTFCRERQGCFGRAGRRHRALASVRMRAREDRAPRIDGHHLARIRRRMSFLRAEGCLLHWAEMG